MPSLEHLGMRPVFRRHGFLFALAGATAWATLCFADAQSDTGGTIEPEVDGIGALISIAGDRYIGIHRQLRQQDIGPIVHYFHKPLFILKTIKTPLDGYPPIVLTTPRQIGDLTYLNFGLIMTTAQFQEDARAFVIANDPGLQLPNVHVNLNDIKVGGWPIISLRIKLIEPLAGTVLGEWISPSLEAASPTISFYIGMKADALELFKRYAGSGDIQFTFSYTFQNKRQEYAVALSTAYRDISEALRQAVMSENISTDAPIFQDQANKFKSTLAIKLATEIHATSAALVPLVQTQLADHYLTAQVVTVNDIQDKALLDAIYGYLKPLLQTSTKKRTEEQSTTTTHEDGSTVKLGVRGNVGSFEIDNSDKDSIQSKTGLIFEYNKADQAFERNCSRRRILSGAG